MLADIEEAMRVCRESTHASSTSDLHVEGNEPPWHRVDGTMLRMNLPIVEPESIRAFCETYLSKAEYERLTGAHGAADGALQHPSFGAIRIHAFRGENGLALSLRLLRDGVPDLVTLGLPQIISKFADYSSGLILFTGPTPSEAPQAINRIIGLFPADEQESARVRLSDSLRAILGLRLLPLKDGTGLRVAAEVVIANEAVRRLIRDGAIHQLRGIISSSRREGMQTLETHLSELVAAGEIDLSAARAASLFPDDVRESTLAPHLRR